MYLNTFLYNYGLDPENFINEIVNPIKTDDGKTLINIRQKTDKRVCPYCGCLNVYINNYYWSETNSTINEGLPTVIRIKKVRFMCTACNKTFTPKITGIERYSKISKLVENLIIRDFYKQKSFSIIADSYNISSHQCMDVFDKTFPYLRRGVLPSAMCIDEIGFKTDDGSYASIIYDHDKKIITDVIRNRNLAYLRQYFSQCSFRERTEVKYFISDLYEGYATIKQEYFREAVHIADMYHVIRLLQFEISKLRVDTYKNYTDEHDPRRNFMKNNWDVFEKYLTCKLARAPYYSKAEKMQYTFWDMMHRCLSLNPVFWDAYTCLQDFYEYWRCKTFNQAILHIEKIVKQLKNTGKDELIKVANTYWKWRTEIANAITTRNIEGKRYSNGPAEGLNNAIKTLIKDANGYRNFDRLRKRILLVLNYGKDPSF